MNNGFLCEIERDFCEHVTKEGGFINAHTHLDRANTNGIEYWRHYSPTFDPLSAAGLPLSVKQELVGELHKGKAYTFEDLIERMGKELQRQFDLGHTTVNSLVDATPDLKKYHGDHLVAVRAALKLKQEFQLKGLTLNVFALPIFGFKSDSDDLISREQVLQEAAELCDGIGGLPEKDHKFGSNGYDQHLKIIISLAKSLNKPVQIHVDQANLPSEEGTERLIQAVHWLSAYNLKDSKDPMVWAVHSISPACYDEARFKKMVRAMVDNNIGLISCPSAALGMRQIRSVVSPVHNSIQRLLELMEAGVRVMIGTDNIQDVFMPFGHGRVLSEIFNLAGEAIRFYQTSIWLKIATGKRLNNMDKKVIRDAIRDNQHAWEEAVQS